MSTANHCAPMLSSARGLMCACAHFPDNLTAGVGGLQFRGTSRDSRTSKELLSAMLLALGWIHGSGRAHWARELPASSSSAILLLQPLVIS